MCVRVGWEIKNSVFHFMQIVAVCHRWILKRTRFSCQEKFIYLFFYFIIANHVSQFKNFINISELYYNFSLFCFCFPTKRKGTTEGIHNFSTWLWWIALNGIGNLNNYKQNNKEFFNRVIYMIYKIRCGN